MTRADPIQTFLDESTELLEVMEDLLLNVESNADDPEAIDTLFRSIHTIKGSSGVFGFDGVVRFTHGVETVLDQIRAGERDFDADTAAVLLDCKDHVAALVEAAVAAGEDRLDDVLESRGRALLQALAAPLGALAREPAAEPPAASERAGADPQGADHWHISLRFCADAFRDGMDPLSFLRYLRTLGEVRDTLTLVERVREAEPFDPESCYLGFELWLQSEADKRAIEDVFTFAQDDCEIVIVPPQSQVGEYLALLERMPEDEVLRLGEMLVDAGAVTRRELDRALDSQAQTGSRDEVRRPVGEILVEQGALPKSVLAGALDKQNKTREKVRRESRSIRVDADKLGQLINLVGELVTTSAATELLARVSGNQDLQESVASVNKLVGEIRDSALTLRMVQIGETFNRFRRVVRDLSRELGKTIALQIEGGETELDKTVVESLTDPLMHLVRNAIDHGIEAPPEREARGKPPQGRITLSAWHDSGNIVICIEDDGAGLDVERLREKAIARGVIAADANLSRHDLLNLTFAPGVSTKESASDISGRGVGMDVVRRNIENARGSVEVDSEPGQGTVITIRLPLTLAIIDGFLVGAGGEPFVLPLDNVVECVELDGDALEPGTDHHYVNLRGQVLPFVRLRELFQLEATDRPAQRENLVVVRQGRSRVGLVVDRLDGELQTVIKPLGDVLSRLRVVSGATIMGNGRIAMILDVDELIRAAGRADSRAA